MAVIDSILFVRSISAAQAKVVMTMLFNRRGMSVEELERHTGLGRKALYRACEDLSAAPYNLLLKQTGAHNQAIWKPSGAFWAIPGPDNTPQTVAQMGSGDPTADLRGENSLPDVSQDPNCAGSIRLIDELNLDVDDEFSGSQYFPSLQTIVDSLGTLRGRRIGGRFDSSAVWDAPGLRDVPETVPARLMLAWVVKAYCNRDHLKNPVGLIITRAKTFSPRKLPLGWRELLPADFLQEIGIPPVACEDVPLSEAAPDATEEKSEIFRLYEDNLGLVTPLMADCLRQAEQAYPAPWIMDAFSIALKNNSRRWSYIEAILAGWQAHGRDWKPHKPPDNPTRRPASRAGKHSQADVDNILDNWLEGEE